MKWLRSDPPERSTELAMVGVKSGDRVLVMGAGDGRLASGLALVTGLNGRTLVVDRAPGAGARVEAAAARAGSLVEFDASPAATLPIDDGTFDIVVLAHELSAQAADPAGLASEAARVARPGGRIVVMEHTERTGFRGLLARDKHRALPAEQIRAILADAGLRTSRVLAEVDGTAFVEAIKARTSPI